MSSIERYCTHVFLSIAFLYQSLRFLKSSFVVASLVLNHFKFQSLSLIAAEFNNEEDFVNNANSGQDKAPKVPHCALTSINFCNGCSSSKN